ncbi:MAG: CDP-glycerol glycerophosphotransferase family protein [Propionibacteriaceae bacterium]|nr:CDP-glycerol glycerophosphotransferase family protein [Propionibacteriaceae bacterium]
MLRKLTAKVPRIPLPEYADVAWAAQGNSGKLNDTGTLILYLVESLCIPLTIIATLFGNAQLGLALWFAAGICDWAASRKDSNLSRIASYANLGPNLRALIRSIAAFFPLATLSASESFTEQPALYAGYVLVVVVVQLTWAAVIVLVNLLSQAAPVLRYQPGPSPQDETFSAYGRVYSAAVQTPAPLVIAEGLFIGMWMAFFASEWVRETFPAFGMRALWMPLLAIALATAYGIAVFSQVRKLRKSAKAAEAEIVAQVGEFSPRYVFYISMAFGQAAFMANQWIPVFDRVAERGIMVVREASQLLPLAASKLPVYYAATPRQLETLILPSVKAAFYPSFSDRNAHLMRNPLVKHVMILHGDSDKASSMNALARGYDEIWVAGEAAVERYWNAGIDIPRQKFAIVGRPQAGGLKSGPLNQQPKIVLYAPTFEGYYEETNYTSLAKMGPEIVKWLLANRPDVRIWFKPHPSTGRQLRSMLTPKAQIEMLLRTGGNGNLVVADQRLAINDCLERADILVTDVSSVMTDFLYTLRPIVVCNPKGFTAGEFEARYPNTTSAYRLDAGLEAIGEIFDDALGADSKQTGRAAAKIRLLGDLPGGPQAAFAAEIHRLTS